MNQNIQKFSNFENSNDDSIDLGRILRNIMMQSKLIASITFISFILSVGFYLLSPNQYKITSLLQVESFNQSSLDPTDTLQMMSPLNSSLNLDNIVELYKSRTNLIKLINDLQLNIYKDIQEDEKLDIAFEVESSESSYEESFYIQVNDELISLYDKNEEFIKNFNLNEKVELSNGFNILVSNIDLEIGKKVEISYISPNDIFESLKAKLNVVEMSDSPRNFFSSSSGLIQVSYIIDDISKGKKIINSANEIFLKERLSVETEKSRAAIQFLDRNISTLVEVTDFNKKRLNEFLESNSLINVELETQATIETIQSIEDALKAVQLELANAEDIYTLTNPLFTNLLTKKSILESQKNNILNQIKEMPKEQQEYIDLFSDLEISKALLEELQTRRLGFSILEASTIGDIRVVDSAYKESKVSPNISSIIIFTFISFLFACGYAIFRGINLLPITNPAEIMDNNIHEPIIGVIPFSEEISESYRPDNHAVNSSLESLVVNLSSLQNDDSSKKIILVSSPSPANGKSTISASLAITLANTGKKVLLIDCDLKKGTIATRFKLPKITKEQFINFGNSNLEDYKIGNSLFILPRIKNLQNSFQFLLTHEFKDTIDKLRDDFDHIILDTAPILSVADTAVLSKYSDLNILIARHELTKIRELKQSIDTFNQIGQSINGLIYNAYAKPKGYYGYYNYYGNYAYKYYSDRYLYEAYEYKK